MVIAIVLLSCQETSLCDEKIDQTTGLVVRVLDKSYFAYNQQQGVDLGAAGIRISTSEQYKRVFSACCESRLDSIDFKEFEILGLTTVNRGFRSGYLRDIKRDDTNRKIIYTVTEQYCKRRSTGAGILCLSPNNRRRIRLSTYEINNLRPGHRFAFWWHPGKPG